MIAQKTRPTWPGTYRGHFYDGAHRTLAGQTWKCTCGAQGATIYARGHGIPDGLCVDFARHKLAETPATDRGAYRYAVVMRGGAIHPGPNAAALTLVYRLGAKARQAALDAQRDGYTVFVVEATGSTIKLLADGGRAVVR